MDARDRLPYIDGLRAVAVMGVVVFHAGQFHGPFSRWAIERAFDLGAHGVDLFFVISGFCLSFPYLSKLQASGSYTFGPVPFFSKRLLRIVPPYYVAIILAFLVTKAAGFELGYAGTPPGILQQLLFLDRGLVFLAVPFWTLPIELRWYFVFPLVLWVFVVAPRLFAAVAVTSYALFFFTRVSPADGLTLPCFMMGVWAANIYITRSRVGRFALPLLFATLPVSFIFARSAFPDPITALAMFSLVVVAGRSSHMKAALSLTPVRIVGVASYSIYLLHYPVMRWMQGPGHAPMLASIIAGVGSSFAFWLIIERSITKNPFKGKALLLLAQPVSYIVQTLNVKSEVKVASRIEGNNATASASSTYAEQSKGNKYAPVRNTAANAGSLE